jgi:hypothetical protein
MNEQTSCPLVCPAVVGELHITPDFVALVVEEAARRGYPSIDPTVAGFLVTVFLDHVFTSPTAAMVVQRHFEEGLALYETAVMLADGEDGAQAAPTRPVRRNALH